MGDAKRTIRYAGERIETGGGSTRTFSRFEIGLSVGACFFSMSWFEVEDGKHCLKNGDEIIFVGVDNGISIEPKET